MLKTYTLWANLYSRCDRTILQLISLLLIFAVFIRWHVTAFYHQSQTVLATFDFWLGHASFYLAFACWLLIMLKMASRYQRASRVIAITLALLTLSFDIIISIAISVTGDSNSLYSAYYFLSSISPSVISIHSIELFFFVATPLSFALPLLFKIRLLKQDKPKAIGSAYLLTGLSISCIIIAAIAPLGQTPKSLATPPVIYLWKTAAHIPSANSQQHIADKKHSKTKEIGTIANPFNIVIVALESTRASSISYYNPSLSRKTAFYDQLAKNSLVANKAYTIVPHTSKALTSINCGREPYLLPPILESKHGIPSECLARQLNKQGYDSVFFQSATGTFENRQALVNELGFKEFYPLESLDKKGYNVANMFSYEDDIMLPKNKQWLNQRKTGTPFFAFYLTGTPHWQYLAPDKYGHHQYIDKIEEKTKRYNTKELNLYFNAVHYQDKFLEQLFAQYKAAGLYDNTIFVLVGDHGENFGEHRHFQHNNNLYQEVLHIPLLVHAPALPEINRQLNAPVSQLDIIPTLQYLLGSGSKQDSLLNSKADNAIYSSCWYWQWCLSRVDSRYKYIYNYDDAPSELYDLINDPKEAHNIATEHPQLVRKFEKEVHDWFARSLMPYADKYQIIDPDYLDTGVLEPAPPSSHLNVPQLITPPQP